MTNISTPGVSSSAPFIPTTTGSPEKTPDTNIDPAHDSKEINFGGGGTHGQSTEVVSTQMPSQALSALGSDDVLMQTLMKLLMLLQTLMQSLNPGTEESPDTNLDQAPSPSPSPTSPSTSSGASGQSSAHASPTSSSGPTSSGAPASPSPSSTSGAGDASAPASTSGGVDSSTPPSTAGSPTPASDISGAGNGGEVNEFETMNPGEAPNISRDENGKIVLDRVVDDSFIPEEDRIAMKEAISRNKDMAFYQENFASEEDIYNFQVARMNLESARGTTLENDADAQGTGGGSFGFAHLHDTFGLEAEKYGSPLNSEGWSKDEVAGDMGKYMDLVMRSDEGNYLFSKEQGRADPLANAMGMWWTGSEDNTAAGDYYLSAMSAGKGVNHHTGANML